MTRVLIADDHPIFRRGLREVLRAGRRHEVIAEVADGRAALAGLREHRPDVALLDISMPELDGLEVLAQAATWADPPAIVLLTMYEDYVQRAMNAGARGYLLKENAEEELIACLDAISRGERYVSEAIEWRSGAAAAPSSAPLAALTLAEIRVLRLLAQFKTSREIAEILCVSPRTVQNHRANMCAKLGLRGAKALLQFALEHAEELSRAG